MIKLQVQWPNATHLLLALPNIDVKADGAPLDALSRLPGRHNFEVPDGTSQVELQVTFSGLLPLFLPDNLEPFTLFEATQIYRVEQDALIADSAQISSRDGKRFVFVRDEG